MPTFRATVMPEEGKESTLTFGCDHGEYQAEKMAHRHEANVVPAGRLNKVHDEIDGLAIEILQVSHYHRIRVT